MGNKNLHIYWSLGIYLFVLVRRSLWHFWADILLARLLVVGLHNPVQMLMKMNGELLQQFLISLFAYGVLCQVMMFTLDFTSNQNMASILFIAH